jgi:hypothetical protein
MLLRARLRYPRKRNPLPQPEQCQIAVKAMRLYATWMVCQSEAHQSKLPVDEFQLWTTGHNRCKPDFHLLVLMASAEEHHYG